MKATDLRSGNLIKFKGVDEIQVVSCLNYRTDEIGTFDRPLGKSSLYESIPMTEEWLLKLGFEAKQENGFDFVLNISAAKLYARANSGAWFFQFNETYLGQLFTGVHHIQNFCASLGKELEVKL
ncbi:hypothetical protein [Pedobacter africanus]|uniref:Uncharacterized protein n=1 Tax=Pedobacter africanus TaxID=151894 RepID=A0A1W1ZD18_9SPHI|nr:hypothetical protein [Pedobacter africanus]SMC45918.1 hypothetical protein SAMN04488524_0579 [Pedobacter africanus]